MSEDVTQEQVSDSNDPWTMDGDAWETAGLTRAGKVGFKVTSATPDSTQKDNAGQVKHQAVIEISINQRPDRKVGPKGEDHREYFNLGIPFVLKKFKGFAAALGVKVKPEPGQTINVKDIIKALNGRPGFGTIEHRTWKDRDGNENVSASLGMKFANKMSDLA